MVGRVLIAIGATVVVVGIALASSGSPSAQPEKDPRYPYTTPRKSGAPGASNGEFTIAIEGAKQGKFRGEGTSEGTKDKIVGTAFEYEIKTPRDPQSGAPVGKRQHQR